MEINSIENAYELRDYNSNAGPFKLVAQFSLLVQYYKNFPPGTYQLPLHPLLYLCLAPL